MQFPDWEVGKFDDLLKRDCPSKAPQQEPLDGSGVQGRPIRLSTYQHRRDTGEKAH